MQIPVYDVIIIGAGPAGLGAAYAAKKKGLRHRVLEANRIVNTIYDYPFGKTLFSTPEELELEKETFFCADEHPSREEAIEYYVSFSRDSQLEIECQNRVLDVAKEDGLFRISSEKGFYFSRYVVIGVGINAIPRRLGVPGEEMTKVSYRFWKPDPYKGKKVLIVGGGDSALETALSLCEVETDTSVSYRRARFVRPQEVNLTPFLEKVENGSIKLYPETVVTKIQPKSVTLQNKKEGEEEVLANDFTFLMTGTEPALDFLARIGVETRGKYPVYNEETFETEIKGLYLAGHITKQRFIKSALTHGSQIIEHLCNDA